MTILQLYDSALIEINKVGAPSLLLEDYNYLINKAIQQYINTVYNRYDINQQSTDDLRVLKATCVLPVNDVNDYDSDIANKLSDGILSDTYFVKLPDDYLHILNCVVEYETSQEGFKCYKSGDRVSFLARRLTSDMFGQIIHNAYLKPTYKRPYYYINNINKYEDKSIVDINNIKDTTIVKRRVSNPSDVILELRCGKYTNFKPVRVYIDYIKSPIYIKLTEEDIQSTTDTSMKMEFPDYVCYEIINIFVKLLMENASDPRLQTNLPINQTIAQQAG